MSTYVHPADPRRDNDPVLAHHHAEAAREMHGAGLPHDASACGIPHRGTPEYAEAQRRRREDFKEPAYALGRFTDARTAGARVPRGTVVSILAEMHRSAVEEARGSYARPCAECGTPMTMGTGADRACGQAIEIFTAVAVDGTSYGPAADLVNLFDPAANWLGMANPYAYLARLGDLCSEATSVKRAETTWLYERTSREYVSLKVRLDTGGIYHHHRIASQPWNYGPNRPVIGDRACVYHCTMPAMLRPSGWYCRECGELLTDATAEIRMVPVYAGEALPPKLAVRREVRGYGDWPANPAPVKRRAPACDVCDRRRAALTKVPQFGNRLVCGPCIEEAKLAGVLPA